MVNPAPRGSNVRKPFQRGRKSQYKQRKRGQFYNVVQSIKRDWKLNKEAHPRGYVFESHHKVVPVPAPTALDLAQPGVRVLDSGLVDHYFHITETHVPIPTQPPTSTEIRRKFKRARIPDCDGKNLKTTIHFSTQIFK